MSDLDWSQFQPVSDDDPSVGVQAQFASLTSAFPDAQISSLTRSEKHNAEVGGVPTSQHIPRGESAFGTAMDVVVPKDQRSDFQARASSLGLQAIDEGTHIHLQLPHGSSNVDWSKFEPVDAAPPKANGVDWSQFRPAEDFSNVQAGVSSSPSFGNVQSGADTTSTGPVGYYAKKFSDEAANLLGQAGSVPEGALETAANFESQGVAIPAGGAVRLGLEAVNTLVPKALQPIPLPNVDEAQQTVTEGLTYQPQSGTGQQLTAATQYPFQKLAEGADYLGQKTLDTTGSPALAAAVSTAVQVVPLALGGKAVEGFTPRAPRAAEAVVAAHEEAQAAGKPSWEATQDALQAIQESDSASDIRNSGTANLSPEETRPPVPENADLGNQGNPSVKKTDSEILGSDSVQAAKDADLEAAQRAAWGGDFSHLPDATDQVAALKDRAAKLPNSYDELMKAAPDAAHPLFDDLVPQEEAPAALGKVPLSQDPSVTRDEMGYYYRDGKLVGMPKETARPRTEEELAPQRASPEQAKKFQSIHDAINTKLNTASKAWDFLSKGNDDIAKLAKTVLDSKNPDRETIPVKAVNPEDLLTSKNSTEQLFAQGWKGAASQSEAPLGLYSGGKVYLRGAGFGINGLDRATMAHELLHSEILGKVKQLRQLHEGIGDADTGHLHPKTRGALEAYRELERTRDALANNPDLTEGKGVPVFYKHAVSNVDELTSVAMTDPAFRRYLDNVKVGAVTAWSKIKDLWGKMLGVSGANKRVLDHIAEHVNTIVHYNPEAVAMEGRDSVPAASAGERVSREDIDKQAQAALSKGANPDAVNRRQMDLYRQHGHEPAPTSTKNAVRDAERVAEGRDPIVKEAAQSNQTTFDAAKATLEKNPNRPNEIMKRLTEDGVHSISTEDEAVLLIHKAALRNMRDDASKIINDPNASDTAKFDARTTWGETEAKINMMDHVTEASGREWGRFGQFRQRMLRSDYSLDAMERKRRTVLGGRELSPEEQKAVKTDFDAVQKAQKEFDASQAKVQATHENSGVKYTYENMVKEMAKQLKGAKKKGTFLETLKANADESRDWFKKNLSKSSAGVDPTAFFHLARIGAYHIANGAVKFADWVGKMKAELGAHFSKVEDSMPAVFKAAKEQHAIGATEAKPRLKAKASLDPNNITHKDVYDLARAHIINGVHGEDAVMKAVHGDLKEHGLTERDVRRLFSEYGEAKFPSKEADKTELREIRSLVQMQESIDRINEGLPALKSGVQRDKATAIVREKRRQLNDLLKDQEAKNGMSPEKLVTYQEMRARNLRNQIEDLQKEIATGEKKVRKPTPADSQEVQALKVERDQLKDELKKIEDAKRQPAPSDPAHERAWHSLEKQISDLEAKIKARDTSKKEKAKPVFSYRIDEYKRTREALKRELDDMHSVPPKFPLNIHEVRNKARRAAIERQMENLDRQIAAGGEKLAKLKPSPDDAETKALKNELAGKQAQLKALRDAKNPPPSPEEKYQATRGKQLQRELNKVYDRITANDYTPRKVEIKELNAENANLARKLYEAKNLFNRHQFEIEMSLRTPLQKLFGGARDAFQLARAVQTSWDLSATMRQGGFIFWGHPIRGARALLGSIKAGRGEEFAYRVQHEIEHRENFYKYKAAGLELTFGPGHKLLEQEEKFMSRWLEKSHYDEGDSKTLTAAKKVKDFALAPTRASERAFRSYLNKLRADSFDTMVAAFARDGRKPSTVEMKAIADYINVATGRGHIGFKPQTAVGLNTVFFAPRLVGSRFNLLFGQPLIGKLAREVYAENRKMGLSMWESTRLHRMIGAEYGRYAAGVSAAIYLAYLAHQAFGNPKEKFMETDWRSSDYGKFRFGNSWYDPWSGMAQVAALVGKLSTRETKTGKGQIKNLTYYDKPGLPPHKYGDQDIPEVLFNFARKKLAPAPGAAVNAVTGKNVAGQKTTPLQELGQLVTPMTFDTTYNAYRSAGVPHAIADTLADFFGTSVSVRNLNNQPVTKKEETDGR